MEQLLTWSLTNLLLGMRVCHVGKSHKNLNTRSIGIEIQNSTIRINMKVFNKTDQESFIIIKNFKKI